MSEKLFDNIKPGVVTGEDVQYIFKVAKENQFAMPAVNVTTSSTINAVMEAAIAGAVAGAKTIHHLAELYGVRVILHTDHAAKKLLPWIDGLLDAGEKHFAETGKPLFSSHMLDLSEEPLEENIAICKEYLARMSKIGMTIEIELGVTGGEEDGVDNSDVDNALLYTQPEEVAYAYEELQHHLVMYTVFTNQVMLS